MGEDFPQARVQVALYGYIPIDYGSIYRIDTFNGAVQLHREEASDALAFRVTGIRPPGSAFTGPTAWL
jgi:hypothetical protein